MYKPKHFELHELVSKKDYETIPHWKLWLAFDERLLKAIDFLREKLGPVTINNWLWGGDREHSGLRLTGSPYYSMFSQHSFGRAVDMIFKNHSAVEARKKIKEFIKNGEMDHIGISFSFEEKMNGIEISWCHMDIRNNKPGYNGFNV